MSNHTPSRSPRRRLLDCDTPLMLVGPNLSKADALEMLEELGIDTNCSKSEQDKLIRKLLCGDLLDTNGQQDDSSAFGSDGEESIEQASSQVVVPLSIKLNLTVQINSLHKQLVRKFVLSPKNRKKLYHHLVVSNIMPGMKISVSYLILINLLMKISISVLEHPRNVNEMKFQNIS